ncbi:Fur family ferric uptake transcriptional regulator [Maritalea mobilis]|uniref:Ferric uptake regulation protein n=1 Tax=Maritalea mobilis TaxID=483324 RepID=A0A4R6VFU1_9HYPH|nr:Fur family transcriptional regulator [Maritalea mobilis]TDQ61874.1 Fur family ferric uptake transcriptional regulator [Maritalea mobilis]
MSENADVSHLENMCEKSGMRMTEQRRVIARVLEGATDHPDVEELYRRASKIDERISLSTVYRTVNLFEEAGLVAKHDFKDGRARFEPIPDEHHDHLIDVRSGRVIEFRNEEIEAIQEVIARKLGYKLVDHRLELYGVPLNDAAKEAEED